MNSSSEFAVKRQNHQEAKFLLRQPSRPPRLLVSVRSVLEAERALEGGAEILDVKEPTRGSLGMAPIQEIDAVARLQPIVDKVVPLSVALGEVVDFGASDEIPSLPAGITYAKLGLSRLRHQGDWYAEWRQVRTRLEACSASALKWVAVAYADAVEADSPDLLHVLEAAIAAGCAGLLIDTWTKSGRNLLDYVDVATVTVVARQCRAAGLFLAVAGRLSLQSLPALAGTTLDIVAVRSAACRNLDRTSEVDAVRIAEFRRALRSCWVPDAVS
jgi:(5-formylfuran-3-yl)methyl phosphate synthase